MSNIEIKDNFNPDEKISINGYTIKERIGVGSYGRVYKVYKNNIYYVLKEIPLNLSTATEKINSVQNEAQILSSLNNKYVVKFYESFKMYQNIYILMEFCDNGDLCSFLNKVKKLRKNDDYFLDEDFVWKLFIQMSIGLYYIHSKKIIHRDIKTLNIFLTKNLDAKIGDLGVAKILEDTNHANTFIGTPYYVSPEMCKNKPYNEKSDIWALGCILYELLTFNHPFTANNQPALFIKILNSNFNPFPPGVPEDLKKMVEFILQKNCDERPSMKEIITSYSFQYNAVRIGLEKDLKEVLKVDNLPIFQTDKYINKNRKINNSKTLQNNNNNSKENIIKNQKNSLIISKSVNPMSCNKKSFAKISSNNNIFKKKYILNNKSLYNNKKKLNINYNLNTHIRLVKNNSVQNTEESVNNKRTKSDFNYYLDTNNNNNYGSPKTNKIINYKKNQNKDYKNNNKKYILNSILLNSNKNNMSPRKTKYLIKSRKRLKDFSEKNISNLINNNNTNYSNSFRFNTGSRFNENINYNVKNWDNSLDKIQKKEKNKNSKNKINNSDILNEKIINHYHLIKKDIKENNNNKEINKLNADIITESEFIKELKNTIKNNPIIINLNDLLNHNFNSDDSKNLNTTSATTLLGKIENPSVTGEQKNEFNKDKDELNKNKKLLLKNVEEEKSDIFNGSCDEFTNTEKIQNIESYFINPIPFSNYKIKINENKKEIKQINEMSKDELMKTRLIYKNKYEEYLEKIKKYSNLIDINEIKKMYKNKNNLKNKDIKIIFNSIVDYVKKQLPKDNIDELLDVLYNFISYDIKYKMTDKIINKK